MKQITGIGKLEKDSTFLGHVEYHMVIDERTFVSFNGTIKAVDSDLDLYPFFDKRVKLHLILDDGKTYKVYISKNKPLSNSYSIVPAPK